MKRVNAAVLTACVAVLLVLIYSGREAAANPATDVADLEQIRGMGNAFAMYHKKYRYFPAMTDVSKAKTIADVRKTGHCLALKLLIGGGFIDDAKLFFSPRNGAIDAGTIAAITKDRDPAKDTTFACAYAYDPGHSQLHGTTVFFGSEDAWLKTHEEDKAHVLSGNNTTQSLERNANKQFFIKARIPGQTATRDDDIYVDDSGQFQWNDSYLKWDVGVSAKK